MCTFALLNFFALSIASLTKLTDSPSKDSNMPAPAPLPETARSLGFLTPLVVPSPFMGGPPNWRPLLVHEVEGDATRGNLCHRHVDMFASFYVTRAHALVSSADPLCTNCERGDSRRGARCLELAFLAFESRSFSRVFRRLERSRSRSFYEE